MGKTLRKVKNFLKPTEKKIAIGALTAAILAVLALWDKIGHRIFTEITNGWDIEFPKVHVTIDYNPLFYPIGHLFGHVKDEFETLLPAYLYGLGWPKHWGYVINQFIWNIPYYVGFGYIVGCSVVEGTRGVGSSFLYAADKVLGKVRNQVARVR